MQEENFDEAVKAMYHVWTKPSIRAYDWNLVLVTVLLEFVVEVQQRSTAFSPINIWVHIIVNFIDQPALLVLTLSGAVQPVRLRE